MSEGARHLSSASPRLRSSNITFFNVFTLFYNPFQVQTVLHNAELYFSWVQPEGYEMTWKRYGSVYPWPLNVILPWSKRRAVMRAIKEWTTKPEKNVLEEVRTSNGTNTRLSFGFDPIHTLIVDQRCYSEIRAISTPIYNESAWLQFLHLNVSDRFLSVRSIGTLG